MHFDTLIPKMASDFENNEVLLVRTAVECFRNHLFLLTISLCIKTKQYLAQNAYNSENTGLSLPITVKLRF